MIFCGLHKKAIDKVAFVHPVNDAFFFSLVLLW